MPSEQDKYKQGGLNAPRTAAYSKRGGSMYSESGITGGQVDFTIYRPEGNLWADLATNIAKALGDWRKLDRAREDFQQKKVTAEYKDAQERYNHAYDLFVNTPELFTKTNSTWTAPVPRRITNPLPGDPNWVPKPSAPDVIHLDPEEEEEDDNNV
jgi:hypothetical protein